MDYVLTTNALTKRYGNSEALRGLSMHVPKGSIYGLVGRNGAGKTTLFRVICGLQEATTGEYSLFDIGNKEKAIFNARKRIGAVIESPAIYLNMSAQDNMKVQLRVSGVSSFERIEELLKLVGLPDTGQKKAKQFSLGMKQRLGIAVALISNPDFLILDEPMIGLDPWGIIEIRELLLKLNREYGITILISSHFLDVLPQLATHYGFIDRGKLLREISAEDLEAACRNCLLVEVSDSAALDFVLDGMNIQHKIVSPGVAEVYEKVNVSQLVNALIKLNCEVFSMRERNRSLERYYLELIEGKNY